MQMYRLSPDQQAFLRERLIQVGQQLLAIDFTDPAQDARMIRYHAYQKGKYDMITEMLQDNFPETDYTEQTPE